MNNLKRLLLKATGLVFLFAGGAAIAQEAPMTAPAGVKLVEAKAVQALQAKGAVLIDARRTNEFAAGTIKGAISVPYDPEKSVKDANFDASQDKFDMSKIADKSKDYVVFCNSGVCWKSYKAVVAMAKAGYTNVYWYRAGVPDWKARRLPMD